jgi:thioredoxin reductase (NADPH)
MAHKALIIGGGPAGYTAAVYLARARLDPVCIEGLSWGGQLMTTSEVENFPGFPEGVDGPDLMERFRKQAERFGTTFISKDVTRVEISPEGPPHRVHIDDAQHETNALLVATGAAPRKLGLESEERLWARGVSSCATCDGAFFRDRVVAVIGGGDSAVEEATYLTRFASRVYLVHRRDELRASQIMQERALQHDKIEILWSQVVEEVLGEEKVTGMRLRNVKDDAVKDVEIDGFFLAIGHIPSTQLFEGQLAMDENGYLTPAHGVTMEVPGVFACGDCVDHHYRQAITAAGMGCQAAIDAERWLEEQNL